jgi:hypothetical protein
VVENEISREMFDEAIRVGNHSVTQAHHYLHINRVAVNAMAAALAAMRTGRITEAKDLLEKGMAAITRMSAPREVKCETSPTVKP